VFRYLTIYVYSVRSQSAAPIGAGLCYKERSGTPENTGLSLLRDQEGKQKTGGRGEGDQRTTLSVDIGITVSATEARTTPLAKARAKANTCSEAPVSRVLPTTAATVNSMAVAIQVETIKPLERPPLSLISTAPPKASGRLEAKIPTKSARIPVNELPIRPRPKAKSRVHRRG